MMDVQLLLQKIKEKRGLCPLTNVYTLENLEHTRETWESEKGLAFAVEDHGINRLRFFAADKDELCELLKRVQTGKYYIEYLSKNGNDRIPGLRRITRLMRLVNNDCRQIFDNPTICLYRDDTLGELARPQDAHEINRLLWSVFQTEISHLLWDEELVQSIEKGQITIHRTEKIDAVLIADVMPRKFYINQIVNKGEKRNIHAMLQSRLLRYAENGGKYVYAWVEENNAASMRFHEKYGMKHDGMWDLLWILER